MGQGCARIRSRLLRLLAVFVCVVVSLGAFSALAASAWVGGSLRRHAQHIAVSIDTSGALGLAVPLPPLAAGDVRQRTVTVRGRARDRIAALALTITDSGGSPLQRRTLELRVDRCSQEWTVDPTHTLRCPGTLRQVIGWQPVSADVPDRSVGSVAPGAAAWLRVSTRLPAAAPATVEGLAIHLQYGFTAS
jgi:hypothetical protein